MKGKRLLAFVLVCALLTLLLGCGKTDGNAPSVGPDNGYAGKVKFSVRYEVGAYVNTIEGDAARQLIQYLETMTPAGKREQKISDAQWTSGYSTVEETPSNTAWLETDTGIYRANLDKKTVCRVESHYGEGELLNADPRFFELAAALRYWPYHAATCVLRNGKLETENQLTAPTTVKIKVKKVVVNEEGLDHEFLGKYWVAVTLQVESTVDQTVQLILQPDIYGDVGYAGSAEKLEMRAGQKKTVTLPLCSPGPWWTTATIVADNTRVFLRNDDWLNR